MKHVFIAGHGRMKSSISKNVPSGVTLKFAVGASYNGSGSLSKAILKGTYDTWIDTILEEGVYYEHYLTPDLKFMLQLKAKSFKYGFGEVTDGEYYLLQTRGKNTATLSGIITYLNSKISGDLTIYWTCCRSPIGSRSLGKMELISGVLTTAIPA